MELFRKVIIFALLASGLAGCQLTEEDKKNLEKANVNLEKVAIAPLISFPAENKTVDKAIEVIVDIDTSVNYTSLALLVDGKEVAVDSEAPYEFTWDPYFWSENTEATFLIRAITEEGTLLRSEIRTVRIGSDVYSQMSLLSPTANSELRNINSTEVSWTTHSGAARYDYRINGSEFSTTGTSAITQLPQIGDYSMSIRAIDILGNKGQWSDEQTITLAPPTSPVLYSSAPVAAENDWLVSLNWSGELISSELQIATDVSFTSILENETLVVDTYLASLATGIYYVRTRTTNEFGHVSDWSDVKTLDVGLFSQKVDMNTYGVWSNEDAPVDFVIEDEHLVVTARKSNESDGSGDDFYVSKVDLQGNELWGKSYKPQMNSPKSIALTSSGYVLPGSGTNWRDGKVIALSDLGNQLWLTSYNSSEDLAAGDHGTFTQQRLENIVEVSPNKYVALQRTLDCIYTGPAYDWGGRPSSCPSENIENKVKFIDRSGDVPVITDHQVAQPASGKYDSFTQLLLTDSGLYAAGRYTAANDSSQDSSDDGFTPSASTSGAVLLKLRKTDGTIISTRTAGGIKGSSLTSIAETKAGDIVVGYNYYNAAVTSTFKLDGGSDSKIVGYQKNAQVVADPNGDGYITLAQGRHVDDYYLTRYNESNERVGESKRLSQCFRELRAKKIKSHPKHGIVILGTDKWGSGYGDTHTVYFNLTDDFKYACPE